MNTNTTRGRKPIAFSFPSGEFKVKELAQTLNVSIPFIHIKMKQAGVKIKKLRFEKSAGATKGRSAGVYLYDETAS